MSTTVWSTLLAVFLLANTWSHVSCAFYYWATNKGLTEVPTDVSADTEYLYIDENKITSLKANSFPNLPILEKIYLWYNDINQIEPGAFTGLDKLQFLHLGNNKLEEASGDMWEGLTGLIELDVMRNLIATINPGGFSPLSTLKSLRLTGNKLTEIDPNMWTGLTSLEWLDLNDNQLVSLADKMFTPLVRLKILDLGSNEISDFSKGTFTDIETLEKLYLTLNKLTSIPPTSFSNPSLQKLWLNYNDLTTLNDNMFQPEQDTRTHPDKIILFVSHNPFNCDSSMCWIKQAEQEGWINFPESWRNNKPECENFPEIAWVNVTLDCTAVRN